MRRFKLTISLAAAQVCLGLVAAHDLKTRAGDLDTSFGREGFVLLDFSGNRDTGVDVQIDRNGRIVVAAEINEPDFGIARFQPNGRLHRGFGSDGTVRTDVGRLGRPRALELIPSGKILIAGVGALGADNAPVPVVVRLLSNGTIDQAFGIDGVASAADPGFNFSGFVVDMAVQKDGTILVLGVHGFQGETTYFLTKLLPSGALDTTFGGTGLVIVETYQNTASSPAALGVQPSGNIVIAGNLDQIHPRGIQLFAYTPYGVRAAPFGSGGATESTILDSVYDMVIHSSGRIILAGGIVKDDTTQRANMGVARFTRHGELDFAFGHRGLREIDFSADTSALAFAIALQPNNRIVVGGRVFESMRSDFALARLRGDGSLDAAFGIGGLVRGPEFPGASGGMITALAIQPDGRKIIATGDASTMNGDIAVARYHAVDDP
jgi:uncharacterized delta-60 repeat protein